MKGQSKDTIWYDGKIYLLECDSSHQLPIFDKLGIKPRYSSTDCLRGYLAVYEFISNNLILAQIVPGHVKDLDKYHPIKGIPPKVGGYKNCDVIYNLQYPMAVDTTLTIGSYDERHGDILTMQLPAHEVLKLKLTDGYLQQVADITKQYNELHAKILKSTDNNSLSLLLKQYVDLLEAEIS